MSVMWLASFPVRDKGRRVRLRGVRNRLGEHANKNPEDLSESARVIHGLMQVVPGQTHCGPLTAWPSQVWNAFQAMDNPLDAFTFHVQGVFVLTEPLVVNDVLDRSGTIAVNPLRRRPFFWPSLPEQRALEGLTGQVHNHVSTLQEVLRAWGVEDCLTNPMPLLALALQRSDAIKIMSGSCTCLFCLARWMSMSPADFYQIMRYPPPQWVKEVVDLHEASCNEKLSSDDLDDLLQQTRHLWQHYTQTTNEEDGRRETYKQKVLSRFRALLYKGLGVSLPNAHVSEAIPKERSGRPLPSSGS